MSTEELIEKLWAVSTINTVLINLLLNSRNKKLDENYFSIIKKVLNVCKKQMDKELSVPTNSFVTSAITLTNKTLSQIDSLLEELHTQDKEEEFLFPTSLDDEGLVQLGTEVKKRQKVEEESTPFTETLEEEPIEKKEKSMFTRMGEPIDEWDILNRINRLFETYKHSHMQLPEFWNNVCRELLSYKSESENEENIFVIKTPVESIFRLIQSFLRDAPFARILQDMKKKHSDADITLSCIDSIKENVREYITHIEDHLKIESASASDKVISKAEYELEIFDMGNLSLEKRVLLKIRDVSNNLATKAKTQSHRNEFQSIVYAEASILLSKLNKAMLATPEIDLLLKAMKP